MNKPTPGPWRWNTAAGIYGANNKRCANSFVQGEIILPYDETDANAALIVAAVNAYFAVNPDNPIAAAEALPDLVNALLRIANEACPEAATEAILRAIARAALAKIEARP